MPSEEYRRYAQRTRNRLRERQQLAALGRGAPLRNGGIGAGGIHVDGGTIDIDQLGAIEIHGGGGIDVYDGGDVVVHDAGTIDIIGGGSLSITDGGGIHVYDGGDIVVSGGGSIDVRDGGNISAEGGTFTGATFRTQPTGNRGIRMSEPGLEVWSRGGGYDSPFSAGTKTFMLAEGSGRVDMRDRLVVGPSANLGASGPGVVLLPYGVGYGGSNSDHIGIFFNRYADTISYPGYTSAAVYVGDAATASRRPLNLRGYNGGEVKSVGEFWAERGITVEHVGQGSGFFRILDPPTTSYAANTFIDTWGIVYESTSTQAVKDAITPAPGDWAERILAVDPVTFYDRGNDERFADYLTRVTEFGPDPDPAELDRIWNIDPIPGVVAEHVHAAGLEPFVTYDRDGQIKGVMYDRLWLPLIPVVRDLTTKVQALTAELTDLRDQLTVSAPDPAPEDTT